MSTKKKKVLGTLGEKGNFPQAFHFIKCMDNSKHYL